MMKLPVSLALLALALTAMPVGAVDESPLNIEVVRAFPNLRVRRPVVITHANDGSHRLFLATQQGVISFIPDNQEDVEEATEFLDIEDQVVYHDRKNEEGLLGLAFHPNYKSNGYFYVYYTTTDAPLTSVVSRFTVSKSDPNKADPDSEVELMRLKQPFWNHNGGSIEFGKDGYLYIGLGDGGARDDPHMNGQNVQTLLGSILRIDVNNPQGKLKYGIPADNPFAKQKTKQPTARREIYAYGFRNPWRLTFDQQTGQLWVADVGQDIWEEINIVTKGGNYGWDLREGKHKFGAAGSAPRGDLIEPVWEYDHTQGKSITGGHLYRGKKVPSLQGYYLYADYVTMKFWALKVGAGGKVLENRSVTSDSDKPIITFGADQAGEAYCSDSFGMLYRFQVKK